MSCDSEYIFKYIIIGVPINVAFALRAGGTEPYLVEQVTWDSESASPSRARVLATKADCDWRWMLAHHSGRAAAHDLSDT
jgi:hypothetical protein